MKKLSMLFILCGSVTPFVFGQKKINDESIRFQQERMVFKQWDKQKFKPSAGFLGLNPLYWLTWAWHTDYPKHDLRPLGVAGSQSQRLALAAAMQNTEQAYKRQTDTLSNSALSELANYSGLLSGTDPLWLLYCRHQFKPLLEQQDNKLLDGLDQKEKDYIEGSKVLEWYLEESHALAERLHTARTTTLDRGSRILAYQRLLDEYGKLNAVWEAKKRDAGLFLKLSESREGFGSRDIPFAPGRSDLEIADEILRQSKL
jgi:hypothetical protein